MRNFNGTFIKKLLIGINLFNRLFEFFTLVTADIIFYIHDQHLPALLEHARGAMMINSTVGLSAIHHNTPLKVCGTAIPVS